MQLPTEDPEIFRLFVHWLYTGKIPSTARTPCELQIMEKISMALIRLYVFAEKYDVAALCESSLKMFARIAEWSRGPPWTVPRLAYQCTVEISPLRVVCAKMYGLRFQPSWITSEFLALLRDTPEFLADMLEIVSARLGASTLSQNWEVELYIRELYPPKRPISAIS